MSDDEFHGALDYGHDFDSDEELYMHPDERMPSFDRRMAERFAQRAEEEANDAPPPLHSHYHYVEKLLPKEKGDEFEKGDLWIEQRYHSYVVPLIKKQWRVFKPFFEKMQGCSQLGEPKEDSHPVRIGREMKDVWLRLRYNDLYLSGPIAKHRQRKLRQMRDSMLAMTLLARTDHDSYLGALARYSKVVVPKDIDLIIAKEIPPRFLFEFGEDSAPAEYGWNELQCLLDSVTPITESDQLYSTLYRACVSSVSASSRQALQTALAQPISFKLKVAPRAAYIPDHVALLQQLTQTVVTLQALSKNGPRVTAQGVPIPLFNLVAIDLDLTNSAFHSTVLKALQKLIETGVHFDSLVVPGSFPLEDWNVPVIRLAWSTLVTSAFGLVRATNNQRPPSISRLVLPSVTASEPFLEGVCTALCKAKTVTHVSFNMVNLTLANDARERTMWAYIGYALFSNASNNQVETVEFTDVKMTQAALAVLADSKREGDPLLRLHQFVRNTNSVRVHLPPPATRPVVKIEKGTSFFLYAQREESKQITLDSARLGIVVYDEASQPSIDVLIAGIGLCGIARSKCTTVGATRELPATPSRISSLVFSGISEEPVEVFGGKFELMRRDDMYPVAPIVDPLLRILGGGLTSLSLGGDDLHDESIAAVLRLCPRLENLSIRGAKLHSLDAIISKYVADPDFKLSSLDLRDLTIDIRQFEAFIKLLSWQDHPITTKLRCLRIGRGWSDSIRKSTQRAMERMLERNRFLNQFQLFTPADKDSLDLWDPSYNSSALVPLQPLPLANRVAFLSVLKHQGNGLSKRVPSEVAKRIFSYCDVMTWRRAFTEPDMQPIAVDEDFY